MCLSVEDFGDALALTAQTMQPVEPGRVSGYMEQALESLASALERSSHSSVVELEILPQEEYKMLTQTLNTTLERSANQLCIHHHFEQQVERSSEAIAITYEDQSLSYGELNARANTLAHHLITLGVQPDHLVAICVQRTPEMIVGLLAILKAGGGYLPLDPAHASERLMDIVLDASPSIVLADLHGAAILRGIGLTSVQVIDLSAIPAGPITNPIVPNLSPDHLAYVIYTSGSTGKPKGVMVEHAQVTRLFTATTTTSLYDFSEHDTWTMLHSFAFDFSVWEIWGALLFGGKLALFSHEIVRSSQELYRAICEQNVTVLNVTPSAFRSMIEVHAREDGLQNNSLRYVILGGEALAPAILRPWFTTHGQDRPQVVNMYGITETTVHVTHRRMTLDDCGTPVSPIGLRIPDLRTYVLDNRGKPCPFGAVGELYIGGAGVTRGYLNRSELTAERFIRDPFAGDTEARMYRTGDLARYLPDGQLVYLGRNDHQIKIRGFRIELGEIVANLTDHPLVSEAFVIAMGDDSDKRLVSYVVTKSDEEACHGKEGKS
jgi:amino acid adenylation domain-containing protein